jgi:SAM-dependent methyltransferase
VRGYAPAAGYPREVEVDQRDTRGEHAARQVEAFDTKYAAGVRGHVESEDPVVRYLVEWRVREATRRLVDLLGRQPGTMDALVMCAGDGLEGSVLLDLGFRSVTVSDTSSAGLQRAAARDARLRTLQASASDSGLADGSFDVVLVQDGLHHLYSPVEGFVEMLRVARQAAVFLEPHDSVAGRRIGQTWEINDGARNYVFRWDRRLVDQVASSFVGSPEFVNASFSFWHHNVVLERLTRRLPRPVAVFFLRAAKTLLDRVVGRAGNQFCGLVLLGEPTESSITS